MLANQDNVSEEGAAYIVDLFVYNSFASILHWLLHCNTIDISLGLFGNVLLLRLLLQLLCNVRSHDAKKQKELIYEIVVH